MAFQPLDGPSSQTKTTVGTVTVVEAKVGGSPLEERKVVTLQPDGKIKVYFGDGTSTPSAATVAADGITHPKSSLRSYEAGPDQPLFILADVGSVDVVIIERA